MDRAVILVGVKKTGGLRTLKAVEDGIAKMTAWATSQQITGNELVTITDATAPVDVGTIRRAVRAFVDRGTIRQLIIYFAGHGVNIHRGEYWLLSEAPDDSNAAVNLDGSVVLARSCSIPHVVFVSDACRTAAQGIRAQSVRGGEIFPNRADGGPEQPTDLFFASALGDPSLEIPDESVSAGGYKALYTDALTIALKGNIPNIVEWRTSGTFTEGYVRPHPLKQHLRKGITTTFTKDGKTITVSQTPDARITSDPNAWIARVTPPAAVARDAPPPPPPPPAPVGPPSIFTVSEDILSATLAGAPLPTGAAEALGNQGRVLASAISRNAATFGPAHFETRCGFKVRGQAVTSAFTPQGQAEIFDGSLIRLDHLNRPSNVLITFGNNTAAILPAVPEFITALSFDDDELESVSYEPADTSWRWEAVKGRTGELRRLRAVIAAASRLGTFRITEPEAPKLARAMQMSKGVDPAMAVYAAYAYHDLGRRDRLQEMDHYLQDEIGVTLFDVALLARTLDGSTPAERQNVLPLYPLLAQGWALLSACRVMLAPELEGIHRHLRSSIWTLFASGAVPQLRAAVQRWQ